MENFDAQNKQTQKYSISFSCVSRAKAVELFKQGIICKDIDLTSNEPYDEQEFQKLAEMYVENMETGNLSYDMAYNNYLDEPEIDSIVDRAGVSTRISSIDFGDNININTEDGVSHEYRDRTIKDKVKDIGNSAKSITAALFTRYVVMKANRIPEVESKMMSETSGGLYHMTSDRAADKIIASGKIKASDRMSSYSMRKKTFFFSNNVELDDVLYNVGDVAKTMTAIKVKPNAKLQEAIDSGKVQFRLDDGAVCIVGDTKCEDGYELEKVQMQLMEKDGKYYYAEKDEQNKEMSEEDKKLDEIIDKKTLRYKKMPSFIRDTLTFPRNARRAFKKFKDNLKHVDTKLLTDGSTRESKGQDKKESMIDKLTGDTYPQEVAGENILGQDNSVEKQKEYTKGEI